MSTSEESWGRRLRRFRESSALSRDAFADRIVDTCVELAEGRQGALDALRIECPDGFSAGQIVHYEVDRRLPVDRATHLLLLLTLVKIGAIASIDDANDWLEAGGQGWLSARETVALFEV
jgi:hypothetical protein